jgi:hypothetical protein
LEDAKEGHCSVGFWILVVLAKSASGALRGTGLQKDFIYNFFLKKKR